MKSSFASVAVIAAALVLPSAALGATSVSVARQCYAEGDTIEVTGGGFTPSGKVTVSLERGTAVLEKDEQNPQAEADGTLSGGYTVANETGWFEATETRFDMTLRALDQTRASSGQPPESPDVSATTSFIFSRWNVGIRAIGGKIHPKRPVTVNAIGYTNAIGKPLYAHWLRGRKRVYTKRLGLLKGPCGDRKVRLSKGFPFRPVARGSYTVSFNSSRTDPRAQDSIVHSAVRVARRIAK